MVGAIIQARMGSTRLPGKVLLEIERKPLLEHIIERLKKCKTLNEIVIATTREELDNAIEDFCISKKIKYYRGSKENVLERFIEAADKFGIKTIIRICADSPLIDPYTIDKMVRICNDEKADLVTIDSKKTSLLDGFEVTTIDFLKKIRDKATEKYHFEHVTYLAKEKNFGKIIYYIPPEELMFTDIRITVDTIEDLYFIREVYKRLYKKNKIIDIKDISSLPFYIFRINRDINQKKPEEKNFLINIITNGNKDLDIKEFVKTLSKNPSLIINICGTENEIKKNDELININLKYLKQIRE